LVGRIARCAPPDDSFDNQRVAFLPELEEVGAAHAERMLAQHRHATPAQVDDIEITIEGRGGNMRCRDSGVLPTLSRALAVSRRY
jgi:hypothetical protein